MTDDELSAARAILLELLPLDDETTSELAALLEHATLAQAAR